MAFLAPLAAAIPALLGGGGAVAASSLGGGLAAAAAGGAAATGLSLGTALAAGGTLLGGLGAYQNAQYQAAIARNNQKIAYANAESESAAAQEKQRRSDLEYSSLLGEQEAAQGASGLDILGASQLRTREWTGKVRNQAAIDLRREGESRVAGFLGDAQNFGLQARSAKTQGLVDLGTSLVGAARSLSTNKYEYGSRSLRSRRYG